MSAFIEKLKLEAESERLQEVLREVLGPIRKAMKVGDRQVFVEVSGVEFKYRMLVLELQQKAFNVTECGNGTYTDSKIIKIEW
jgi:hypothetical protein